MPALIVVFCFSKWKSACFCCFLVPDNCTVGYYGTQCTDKCHCLNGAACDRETFKCEADVTTGLSLCEPGYASDTGTNLDNCQLCMYLKL